MLAEKGECLYGPIHALSALVYPPGDHLVVVLKAYLDDSGSPTERGHNYLTIAGYLSDEDGWKYFEKEWAARLAEVEVPYLHMRQFGDPASKIYERIKQNPESEADFLGGLVEAIYTVAEFCPMTTVKLPDLAAFNAEHGLSLDPYALAIYGCCIQLRGPYKDEKIELVFDRFDKSVSRVATAFDYLRNDADAQHLKPDLLAPTQLQDSESFRDVLPLQAADFIAWEYRKHREERKTWNPSEEDRADVRKLRDSFRQWSEGYEKTHGKPPRRRKSYLALSESPILRPSGYILDKTNLPRLTQRQINGWPAVSSSKQKKLSRKKPT